MNKFLRNAPKAMKSAYGKVAAGASAALASGLALATPSTPGGAISAELAGGRADLMLVIGAAALLIGILILWAYVKRAR